MAIFGWSFFCLHGLSRTVKWDIYQSMSTPLIIAMSISIVLVFVNLIITIARGNKSPFSLSDIQSRVDDSIERSMMRLDSSIKANREELSSSLSMLNASNNAQMDLFYSRLSSFEDKVNTRQIEMLSQMSAGLKAISDNNVGSFKDITGKIDELTKQIRFDMDRIRSENNQKLDEMRRTVDERLQQSLEERISKAFAEVTENLSKLYASLGSLNALTDDVRNINRIFSNVKTRGIWGEFQAENILADILSPEQYEKNYSPKGTAEKVEFAIRLPGKEGKGDVFLPIDSKFPTSDYVKYKEAVDSKDDGRIAESLKALKERVIAEARDISKKYIVPPETTDFAILFLPAESLYAELLRMDGLVEKIQNENRVVLAGPNNFAALLNSLSLGFRTLQIEKHTSEIWKSFQVLKQYFSELSKSIDDSRKAVEKASSTLDSAARKKEQLTKVLVKMERTSEKAYLTEAEYIENE